MQIYLEFIWKMKIIIERNLSNLFLIYSNYPVIQYLLLNITDFLSYLS